ncbi:hypothetical protein EVAR_64660_1 [Eumeta japonica]|uniref:Uncharacterized protein n=1 Tax=Eumeta variegata TaxID=151549 RepID=A0A4C2A3K3_EUMVA|nr:hypothetical protein EVAR_64660_1 [Eumeta japonica]
MDWIFGRKINASLTTEIRYRIASGAGVAARNSGSRRQGGAESALFKGRSRSTSARDGDHQRDEVVNKSGNAIVGQQ